MRGSPDAKRPYRAPRATRKPRVEGPQTAIVVGDSEHAEIWTDVYGRVKVRFHWVREELQGETGDEQNSCWVRVSPAWAGQGWGSMHIPRVDQEVIVDFLEGDPDRPIITGRVYNTTGNARPSFGDALRGIGARWGRSLRSQSRWASWRPRLSACRGGCRAPGRRRRPR